MDNRNYEDNGQVQQKYEQCSLSFVICAYGESPYLEECIRSLLRQSLKGEVLIATSTPNEYISSLAAKYHLSVKIHKGGSLAEDWNQALMSADTEYVTLAHQDDVYGRRYAEYILHTLKQSSHPLIAFTDYAELREESSCGAVYVRSNRLLQIKRLLLFPLRFRFLWGSRFVRRRILSLGSAICCPAVTFALRNIDLPVFENNMKSNIDWQAWELLSREKGDFVYIPRIGMAHRIHADSTTSRLIRDNRRKEEDLFMYRRFWPGWFARIIEWFYQKGEASNQL